MLKPFHVHFQPSDTELLAYAFFTCARKNRVGWKLPIAYFIARQEWVPRSSIKDRVHLVNYTIHKHFKDNTLKYVHRYQWAPFDKTTEVLTIKSLSGCIIEQIYALAAKNQWTLDSISEEQNLKLNYLSDTHLQVLKTRSRYYKIGAGLTLLNLCLLSLLGAKLLSVVKAWQQVQLIKQAHMTISAIPKGLESKFEYEAFADELSEGLHYKQTSFQDWIEVKSILYDYPSIRIDSWILKNEEQILETKSLNQKIMTVAGQWHFNTINSKGLGQPLSLFEQMMNQLRSLPTVESVHCIRYDFISENEIQFTINIDFKTVSESSKP